MEINTEKIDRELKRIGWSRYRLAKEMGVKFQWVYSVLGSPKKSRTFNTVERFADALGMDPKDLII